LDGVKTESKYGTRKTLDILNAEQELLRDKDKIAVVKSEHDEALALLVMAPSFVRPVCTEQRERDLAARLTANLPSPRDKGPL